MHRLTVQYFDPTDPVGFHAAYRERHVPLVKAVPGLERFTLSTPNGIDGTPALVAELWFADAEALKAGLSSAEMGAAAEDGETYAVGKRLMFTGEVDEV